ncbi:MAG: serpin family protein [Actinobacteria bacterium]|nr:serpin family protein [Actinomycetota bacterium]
MIKKLISFFLFLMILSGCANGSGASSTTKADDSKSTPEGVNKIINSNNQFAFDLYLKLKDVPEYNESNIFFSPYSISTALAMTYEGARGQTAEEMRSVFHFPEDDSIRRSSFAKIYNLLNKKDKKYELHTANALWAQKDYKFLEDYMNTIQRYYAGKVTNLDFVNDTENSRITINKWVEEQTNNKIKDLIPQGVLDALTRLVLTNAIYFKSMWIKQFDKEDTIEDDFKVNPEKTVKVPMMRLTGEEATFNYAETEELQILEMLYEGEELSMLILLPKEDNLKSVEESLNKEKITELRNMLIEEQVDVYIPKFKFETKYFMNEILKKMGMSTAFSNADFSGMDGTKKLFISDVIHQAFVEVNEEGTEAAAATGVVMKETAVLPSIVFRADHPFIFMIQERETGNILFLGRVVNPSE